MKFDRWIWVKRIGNTDFENNEYVKYPKPKKIKNKTEMTFIHSLLPSPPKKSAQLSPICSLFELIRLNSPSACGLQINKNSKNNAHNKDRKLHFSKGFPGTFATDLFQKKIRKWFCKARNTEDKILVDILPVSLSFSSFSILSTKRILGHKFIPQPPSFYAVVSM